MRIAQIAPLVERVPPKTYGGTERVVHALTEELVKRGHEVTLFATADSETSAHLQPMYPRSLREARVNDLYGANYPTLLSMGVAYRMQDQFDIIHDHLGPMSLPIAEFADVPVVTTMHGPFTIENRRLYQTFRRPVVATISHSQLRHAGSINHAGMVHNGLIFDDYPFQKDPEGYLLCVGRLTPEKGIHLAIEVAKELDMRLIIAAKLEAMNQNYFDNYIRPGLSGRIEWIGEVDMNQRNELMSKALCFLHPAMWREPFGLTIIEAQACGCPVIAFDRGAMSEVIKNGETGFVVDDVEEMTEAILNIGTIDRRVCRDYARREFNAAHMTDGYEQIYNKLVALPKEEAVA